MGSNIQRLGDTLAGRMKKTASGAIPTTVELGIINANLSLTTDSLKTPIPRGDYMVDIRLKCSTYRTSEEIHSHDGGDHYHDGGDHAHSGCGFGSGHSGGSHDHNGGGHTHIGGSHDHRLPEEFRGLKAGDRVLVVWCGNEPVVTNILVSS